MRAPNQSCMLRIWYALHIPMNYQVWYFRGYFWCEKHLSKGSVWVCVRPFVTLPLQICKMQKKYLGKSAQSPSARDFFIHIVIHTYLHIHKLTHIHTRTHTPTYYIHTDTQTDTLTHAHTYTHKLTHTHTHTHTYSIQNYEHLNKNNNDERQKWKIQK